MYKKQKIVQLAPIHTPMQSQTGAESERCTASTAWLEHWEECSPVNIRKSNQYSKILSTGYSIPIQQSLPIPIQQTAALKALTLFIPYPMCNYVCHVLNIGRFICLPFLCSWIHQPDNKWINLIKTVKHKWK